MTIAVPAFDLTGRIALVTGASSGIGARWSELLARAGARVALCARRANALDDLVKRIEAFGGSAIAIATDVADEAAIVAAYDRAEAELGPVDTIVANAGVGSGGPADQQPSTEFDEVVAVNLRGAFLTAREGALRLIAGGSQDHERGRIVFTCSITAFHVAAGLATYSATKAAVLQMGKVMARDWIRKGINVNSICPGYVRTELTDAWFDSEGGRKQIASFNRRRLMDEDALDLPLLWLCSDLSRGVTGQAVVVDDGQSL